MRETSRNLSRWFCTNMQKQQFRKNYFYWKMLVTKIQLLLQTRRCHDQQKYYSHVSSKSKQRKIPVTKVVVFVMPDPENGRCSSASTSSSSSSSSSSCCWCSTTAWRPSLEPSTSIRSSSTYERQKVAPLAMSRTLAQVFRFKRESKIFRKYQNFPWDYP